MGVGGGGGPQLVLACVCNELQRACGATSAEFKCGTSGARITLTLVVAANRSKFLPRDCLGLDVRHDGQSLPRFVWVDDLKSL